MIDEGMMKHQIEQPVEYAIDDQEIVEIDRWFDKLQQDAIDAMNHDTSWQAYWESRLQKLGLKSA